MLKQASNDTLKFDRQFRSPSQVLKSNSNNVSNILPTAFINQYGTSPIVDRVGSDTLPVAHRSASTQKLNSLLPKGSANTILPGPGQALLGKDRDFNILTVGGDAI